MHIGTLIQERANALRANSRAWLARQRAFFAFKELPSWVQHYATWQAPLALWRIRFFASAAIALVSVTLGTTVSRALHSLLHSNSTWIDAGLLTLWSTAYVASLLFQEIRREVARSWLKIAWRKVTHQPPGHGPRPYSETLDSMFDDRASEQYKTACRVAGLLHPGVRLLMIGFVDH